ncbi:MAG: S8 family serine peptidase, partial [Phycisphaerae bacterium]
MSGYRIPSVCGFAAVALVVGFSATRVWGRRPDVGRVDVLVHLAGGAERGPLRDLVQSWGASIRYEYQVVPNIIALRDLPQDKMAELAVWPAVTKVEPDRAVHADLVDSTPRIEGLQDQLLAEGITLEGTGTRVCILDTGINPAHIMYATRIDTAAGYDFVNNDADPTDDNGHGSHVTGIVAGGTGIEVNFQGGSGFEPLQGVAPETTVIGVKVLDAFGNGQMSDVIAGLEHCASPSLPGGPADVINVSLGDGLAHIIACDTDAVAVAANNVVALGITVVASSGNDAFANAIHAPACASGVISVGATYDDSFPNSDFPPFDSFTFCTQHNVFGFCVQECTDSFPMADQVACYSNKSSLLDVTAPGSYIWSAVHDAPSLIVGRHGTSMAAAHVAGLAALLRSGNPALTPAEIRQFVRDSAIDLGAPGPDPVYGFGRIDVVAALLLAFGCTADADCDDGLFCNGLEQCVAGQCTPGSDPCAPLLCRESDGLCVDCLAALDCDDGDPCNGQEGCDAAGTCVTGTIIDCNGNLIADTCDLSSGTSNDCNGNTVPDECDLAGGTSADCDANGVPDECEPDCNGNGIPDGCD